MNHPCRILPALLLVLLLLPPACGKRADVAGEPQMGAAADVQAAARVARIVYIDQVDCCDCTRERQEKTWANLQAVLENRADKPAVEVVHMDTQADLADGYATLKPIMVTPALYFFDPQDSLVEMLQGEVTAEQLRGALD